MTGERAGALGVLAIAAGAHAGVLLVTAGLGVVPGKAADPTRRLLLQAALRAARPGATWSEVEFIAAFALREALELIADVP